MKNHSCGSCKHFLKIKHWRTRIGGSGLCELFDARTKPDNGHNCKDFKRIKFHRNISLV